MQSNTRKGAGNAASHALTGDHRTALSSLKIAWQLGLWFHRTFTNPTFKSGPFIPPVGPKDESEELRAELARLTKALNDHQAAHHDTARQLAAMERQLKEAQDEREQMATETEQAKGDLLQRLTAQQDTAVAEAQAGYGYIEAAQAAAAIVQLDEADTRKLIDEQLTQAGWQVDSTLLTYAKGSPPRERQEPRHCRVADGKRPSRLCIVHWLDAGSDRRGQAQKY